MIFDRFTDWLIWNRPTSLLVKTQQKFIKAKET